MPEVDCDQPAAAVVEAFLLEDVVVEVDHTPQDSALVEVTMTGLLVVVLVELEPSQLPQLASVLELGSGFLLVVVVDELDHSPQPALVVGSAFLLVVVVLELLDQTPQSSVEEEEDFALLELVAITGVGFPKI